MIFSLQKILILLLPILLGGLILVTAVLSFQLQEIKKIQEEYIATGKWVPVEEEISQKQEIRNLKGVVKEVLEDGLVIETNQGIEKKVIISNLTQTFLEDKVVRGKKALSYFLPGQELLIQAREDVSEKKSFVAFMIRIL
jgi:hypothetical protein